MLTFLQAVVGAEFTRSQWLGGPSAIRLGAISDLLIAFAYIAIPILLLLLAKRRRDLVYRRVFVLFCALFLACACTHALAVVTIWIPVYGFEAWVKLGTAIVSIAAAAALFRLYPSLATLPSPSALQKEIADRQRVEREIRDMNRTLELRVVERTNELERTNIRLVENELRMRSILDNTDAIVYTKDLEGRYTFVNKAFMKLVGRDRVAILGHTDFELFEPDVARSYRENDRRVVTEGALELEETGRSRGAHTTYISNKFPLADFEGRVYGTCGISTDISEHREAEQQLARAHQELKQSEERLRQIMDLVPDMLWSANVDTGLRFISQRYLAYTGKTGKEFENYGFLDAFHPEDRPEIETTYRRAIETGDPAEVEVRIRRHDGVYRWFLSRTVPVWNDNFQVEYLIGAVTDIHELKRTEQALRRSNSELEQFAYAAAHDLQEPLRNISTSLGMFERLVVGRISPEEAEWIAKSIENAIRMQAMVKDLLQYSRAVRDEDKASPPLPARTALQAALSNLDQAIREADAKIYAPDLPEVPAQEQHLVALFQNLLANSLKYRRADRAPEIEIQAVNSGSEWEFTVKDNGIGFDPIYAERIFKVFKRLHSRDEYAGNGIGLAICARIVAHYGGRIWADAVPGQGATFHFTLPTQ